MLKKLLIASMFITQSLWAFGPTVECRFAARDARGHIELDEVVGYTLNPAAGVEGDFSPYRFEISVFRNWFTVAVSLNDEPLHEVEISVEQVANTPVGVSIFGINTLYHQEVEEFVSLRYECLRGPLS